MLFPMHATDFFLSSMKHNRDGLNNIPKYSLEWQAGYDIKGEVSTNNNVDWVSSNSVARGVGGGGGQGGQLSPPPP